MTNKTSFTGTSITALIFALSATPAFAQNQNAPADDGATQNGIADIIVTAQKRAENVQDVPIAISAISSDYLKSRDIGSIDRLGSVAPNVKIERGPSNKTITQISIRGSVTINPAITWEPAVGLYLDGVYIAKAQGSIFDVADLERVEVLRGPQGTLYGRNTLAGAISLITKKPSGEAGGSIEATYGSFDYMKVKGIVDLPQMGIFSAKFSGQYQKRDGFIKVGPNPYPQAFLANPPSVSSTNDLKNYSGMAQLRAKPSDNLTIDYMFDYSKYDQRPDYAQLYRVNRNGDPRDVFDPNSASYPFAGAFFPLNLYDRKDRQSTASLDAKQLFEKSRTMGHALTIALELGDATLKSITAYRNLRFSDSLDLDGSPLNVAFTQRFTKYHAFSQELQLTGSAFSDNLKYVLGGYYFKDKAETLGPQSFFGGGTAFQSDYGSHTEAFAAYGQLDYSISEQFKFSAGLRYTHEKKDIRRLLITSPNTPSAFTAINIPYGGVPDASYNNLSPAFTLSYEPVHNINLYARYAKGFKSGGFNGETNIFGATTPACPSGVTELCEPYRPEKVDSYEVGIKTRLLDNTLQLNAAYFWDEHKDLQLSIFTASGAAASIVRNAAAARIRGFELEAIARPVDWFTFTASFSTLDAKYKRYIDGGVDVSKNRAFPHAPKYTAAFSADWKVAEGNWGKFNLIGDLSFVSKYYTYPFDIVPPTPSDTDADNTRSPGRTIVNMRANFSDVALGGTKANFSLWVRNLTKEKAPQNFIDFGASFGGLTVAYYPDPRTYGVTMGLKF